MLAWLPRWIEQFNDIPDPRDPKLITHQLCVLVVYGIFLFLFQRPSRRAANRALTQPGVWENLQAAFPELATIPHRDTVARGIEAIPPETFETVIVKTIHRLLKNGQLRHWMVLNHYLAAVDGAVKWGAPYQWAEEALKKKTDAGTWYQAYVVEVVLVCPQRVTLPLLPNFLQIRLTPLRRPHRIRNSKRFIGWRNASTRRFRVGLSSSSSTASTLMARCLNTLTDSDGSS